MEPNPRAGSSIFLNQDFDPEITQVRRSQPLRAIDAGERPTPLLALVFAEGARTPTSMTLDRPITIGRGRGCQILVNESIVSREHARLHPVGNGIEVTDLGSRNGTFVDGQRVTRALAGPGSVITVGDTMICLRSTPTSTATPGPLTSRRTDLEAALRASHGNVRRASVALGLARSHVYRLVDRFEIDVDQFRV